MMMDKFLPRCVLIAGSLMCLLGIAHLLIAVPMGIEIIRSLQSSAIHPLTLGNIVTALSVGGAGLLTLYCLRGLRRGEQWASTIALGAGLFIVLVGAGYVTVTPDNPFAYLALLVGLVDVAALGFLRTRHVRH